MGKGTSRPLDPIERYDNYRPGEGVRFPDAARSSREATLVVTARIESMATKIASAASRSLVY